MEQQTAMQQLWDWIDANYHEDNFSLNAAREMSMKLEKDQMIKFAFDFYYDFCIKTGVPFNLISENRDHVEQYFNETYKGSTH